MKGGTGIATLREALVVAARSASLILVALQTLVKPAVYVGSRAPILLSSLLLLGYFLGKQRQQHLVPIFVTFWIALALRNQLFVMRHV
jgi:hypothetical protein